MLATALFALLALPLLAAAHARAAVETWNGGCGGDPAWSCAENWSGDVVPGPGDTVTFGPASSEDSTVDPGFAGTVATVKIKPGYSGLIALERPLTVSTSFSQGAGTFAAADQPLSLKALTLSGGAFVASSDTTSIGGSLKISGAAEFDANGGTVDFDGGSGTLSCDGVAFNQVTFTHAKGSKTVGGDCDLPLGENPTAGAGGSIVLNGTLSGKETLTTSGKLTLGKTGSLAGFSGLAASAGLTVDGKYDFGPYAAFSVHGPFALRSGARFTAPATASFAGSFTIDEKAAFDANGGTVAFDATGVAKLSCGGATFNLVDLSEVAGGTVIGSNCWLPLGKNPTLGEPVGPPITLNGVLSGVGTLTAQRSLKMNGTSHLVGFAGLAADSNLSLAGAIADFGSYDSFTVAGNLAQAGGFVAVPDEAEIEGQLAVRAGSTFNAPLGTLSIGNRFTVSPEATFNADGGVVAFDGTSSAVISCGKTTFNLVTFTNTAGVKAVESSCNLPLGKNPVFDGGGSIFLNGTLSGAGTLTMAGTLTIGSTGSLVGLTYGEELQTILELLR